MGQGRQRLAVHAALIIAFAAMPRIARADNKSLARELFTLAIDEYKAKNYDAAVMSLAKSHALDPKPDTLYALAQAERLAGKCKDAIPHYEALGETSKDEKVKKAVKENIELCKQIEAGKPVPKEKEEDTKALEKRDAPTIEYRTVVRTERKRDVLSIVLFVGGGVAISGAGAMYLVSRNYADDADHATSLEDYNDKYDSSRRLKWISFATAGVGVGLITWGVIRVVGGGNDTETKQVAVTPISGGSMISFSGRF